MICRRNYLIALTSIVFATLVTLPKLAGQDEPSGGGSAEAADAAETPAALTTADPEIPVDHLKLLVDPLTKDELTVEADAWRELLKAKVQEITDAEIKSREKKAEIAEVSEEASTASEPAPGAENTEEEIKEEKADVLETLTVLREESAALIERLTAVLDEYDAKGGDSSEYRMYISAVSGLKVDITDADATWAAIRGWLTSKEGGLKWALLIFKFLVIMLIFWIIAKILERLVHKATSAREGMSDLLKRFLDKIVRRAVLILGLLVALSTLGVNVGALLALMGGGAFIIGFALQDTLGNFAAGIMLLIYRPFDVGDSVEVAGVTGKVDNVSLVSSTIRTFDNRVVLVPNKQVWGQVITNATASDQRRVDMVFGIGYEDDADKALEILNGILSGHELVLDEPEAVIKLHELADSSVNFVCRPWVKTEDYWTVFWDVTKKAKEEFDANGISIPFPQQDVHIHQAEASTA